MGQEATDALEQLLPVGSKVKLELDMEPLDKYGRTLAGVFDSSGRLVNAEVARLGLGVPVVFEPNRKFHPPVVAAFEDARASGAGLTSATIPCLPAQQIERAASAVETMIAAPLPGVDAELDESHAGLVAALATVATLRAAAKAKQHVHWAAYKAADLAAMMDRLDSVSKSGTAHQSVIGAKKKELVEAAESARVAAEASAAESARVAAEAKAAASAAAEAQRRRNLPPAPAPYVPPAPAYVPPAYVAPAAPAPNPYPGYNGPRCYAPGGKSWTPCSKK
jgi:micrococcal nuclease